MKRQHFFLMMLMAGLLLTACQKDNAIVEKVPATEDIAFTVPDIPPEIAAQMSAEDLAKFKAGPGEEFLAKVSDRSGWWHPVLLSLDYDLQFFPFGGNCAPGEAYPCVTPDPGGGPPVIDPVCIQNQIGTGGLTIADGNWFWKTVHAEYFPVFCLPDFAGFGNGFYQIGINPNDVLWMHATSSPFNFDAEGNMTFYRYGNYDGSQSTGKYAGAMGWEISIIYTPAETFPNETNNGIGASSTVTFGWVYY